MLLNKKIELLVVHCSDTPNNQNLSANDIHKMHLGFGWDGIGYHKVINRSGKIEDGRPEYWVGAHVKGKNNISLGKNIIILDTLSYLDFLHLMKHCKVIFTDSGGIQEESTVLMKPCYTLRYNTERPITITQGTNRLVRPEKDMILKSFNKNKFEINKNYSLPFGWDGKCSNRILKIINEIL